MSKLYPQQKKEMARILARDLEAFFDNCPQWLIDWTDENNVNLTDAMEFLRTRIQRIDYT